MADNINTGDYKALVKGLNHMATVCHRNSVHHGSWSVTPEANRLLTEPDYKVSSSDKFLRDTVLISDLMQLVLGLHRTACPGYADKADVRVADHTCFAVFLARIILGVLDLAGRRNINIGQAVLDVLEKDRSRPPRKIKRH